MVIAVLFGPDHVHQQPGEIMGISRRSDLVVDYADGIVGLSDVYHGFDKILAVQSKDPGDPDDKELLKRFCDFQFPVQLRLAVNIERRIVLAVRLPGLGSLSVKYVIRGKVQHF